MKKITALMLALMMVFTMFGVLPLAAEEGGENPFDAETTDRAFIYEEGQGHSPSIWLNTFDYDGTCTGTDYAIFNCAAPIKAIGLPEIYAGRSANGQDATARFELFKWDENVEKTLLGTPVLLEEIYFDGDRKDLPYFTFESAQPAGQYLFRITQITDMGESEEKPYIVLPKGELKYAETKIEFDSRGAFVFFIDFEKTEGITDYFLNLAGKESEIEIQPEKTVIPRKSDGAAHPIFEFGIVTPVIPDGQVLYSLTLINAPTWVNKNGDSDISYEVYKWTGDYDESASGRVLASGDVFDHADNSDLTIKFGTAMRYGNRYLIVILRSNDGAIGFYEGVDDYAEDWGFFEYGTELDYAPGLKAAYALVGDLGPEPTEVPTEEPTVPAEEPTEAAATDEPVDAKTDAPATDGPVATDGSNGSKDDADKKDNSGKEEGKSFPIVPVVICGVIALAAIAAIVIIVAKKKRAK